MHRNALEWSTRVSTLRASQWVGCWWRVRRYLFSYRTWQLLTTHQNVKNIIQFHWTRYTSPNPYKLCSHPLLYDLWPINFLPLPSLYRRDHLPLCHGINMRLKKEESVHELEPMPPMLPSLLNRPRFASQGYSALKMISCCFFKSLCNWLSLTPSLGNFRNRPIVRTYSSITRPLTVAIADSS